MNRTPMLCLAKICRRYSSQCVLPKITPTTITPTVHKIGAFEVIVVGVIISKVLL